MLTEGNGISSMFKNGPDGFILIQEKKYNRPMNSRHILRTKRPVNHCEFNCIQDGILTKLKSISRYFSTLGYGKNTTRENKRKTLILILRDEKKNPPRGGREVHHLPSGGFDPYSIVMLFFSGSFGVSFFGIVSVSKPCSILALMSSSVRSSPT